MGKLGNISGKEAVKAFADAGWQTMWPSWQPCGDDEAGRAGESSIPQHKELSVGTLRALIRAAGLSVDEFLELL